jgi:hypothetical protein
LDPVLDFVMLCDRAEVVEGKLYMMGGGIDTFTQAQFPSVIQFSVAIGVDVPWNATNFRYDIQFLFETQDGTRLGQGTLEAVTGRPAALEPGTTQKVVLAIPRLAVPIAEPGQYVIIVMWNGTPAKRIPFRVVALQR